MKETKERAIDIFMNKEFKIGSITLKGLELGFIVCIMILGFLMRWPMMSIETADYWGSLAEWMNKIREAGGFHSLNQEISNYTSPYMYIMCLLSYSDIKPLYTLKLVSILFDYVACITMGMIVYRITKNVHKSILGMSALLLSPTVLVNSAYWCQCDIIYATFLLISFYFILKENSRRALLFVAIAFSFKMQAVFFLPFLLILWMKKKTILLRDFLWIPFVYVLSAIPACIAGRNFINLMTIYTKQTDTYPWGTLNYPNIYTFLGEVMPGGFHANEVSGAGIFVTIAVLGCLAFYLCSKQFTWTADLLVTVALLSTALTVFCLPHMHERYGFIIDILAVLYGVLRVKRLPLTIGFTMTSFISYMPFMAGGEIMPIQYIAVVQFVLIVFVGYDLYKLLKKDEHWDGQTKGAKVQGIKQIVVNASSDSKVKVTIKDRKDKPNG